MAPQDLDKCPERKCGFQATADCTLFQHFNNNHGPPVLMPCGVYTICTDHHFRNHRTSCELCRQRIPVPIAAEEVPVPSIEGDGSVDSEGTPEGELQARPVHHGGIVINGTNNGNIYQTVRCGSSACSASPSN
ncbi:hypothetical protein CMEL01_10851 [Colletotrichum melonis]|uniref:Uncharacterized protein n=2 Tax=Colletotrichum acutatum species complex TaxID=2707335 RepID=A0AAI9UY02_9PEZI|nr:uncharacterized protein CTAM01_01783 [Colletotrichum tamarilloi]KAK1466858.1 hypothetical protein CMEL01_10851 [Colletotrichum melonis]KAK1509660.1 hypothetical protein CTAM01_01783 [Colletotrichum tamarilloi]